MRSDQTVERIRKIRHEISEQCDHDSKKLIEYYIKYQEKHKDRFIEKPISEKHYVDSVRKK